MKRFHACCPSHATSRVANRISVRLLWALADFSYCSSRFTVRVSFLPHSDLCSSSEMTSLPHGCIFACYSDGNNTETVFGREFGIVRSYYHLCIPFLSGNAIEYAFLSSILNVVRYEC